MPRKSCVSVGEPKSSIDWGATSFERTVPSKTRQFLNRLIYCMHYKYNNCIQGNYNKAYIIRN